MSVFPVNRVPDILKRMDLNSSQAEAMKTCFGILAIMSREDSNKLLIAKDGMEIILNAMTVHVDRTDVQESGCDLLWSLAFNSSAVKDIIAKYGGSVVLVRALKRHSRSADFLKSACGALSNMCQSKLNQEGVSSQGGLQPLVGSIHVHQTNAKLLPFIFDAIASIIVNNEDNARTVSSLGIVPVVVASLSRHKSGMEVVKSGCHTLAILSDVKGQASKIAFAGGVPIILSLLDTHPLYSDLHRVAAVVLLRMLQESAHVGREITCHEGVRILLNSLEKGGAQQDTVAAVTHILYTVTNPSAPSASSIEAQLWLPAPPGAVGAVIGSAIGGGGTSTSGDIHSSPSSMRKNSLHSISNDSSGANSNNLTSLLIANSTAASVAAGQAGPGSGVGPQGCTALTGVVLILGQYSARRDVVRAACRLINNLSGYTNVVTALDRIGVLDKIFECASVHKDTKDVLDSATSLIKTIHRRAMPVFQQPSAMGIQGLVHVFKTKIADEDCVSACVDCMCRLIEQTHKGNSAEKRAELDASRCIEGRLWEHVALTTSLTLLQSVIDGEKDENANAGAKKVVWGKSTGKAVGSVLSLIEIMYQANKLDSVLYKDTYDTLQALLRTTTHRSSDLTRRIEKLLTTIDQNKQEKGPHKRSLISLKPPLPTEEGFLFNGVNIGSGSGGGGASGGNTTLHSRENSSGNISTGPSPLAMGRKVKEYTGPDLSQDDDNNSVTSTTNNNSNGTKRGFGKSKSWGTSLNTLSSGNLNAQEDENSGERGGPVVTTTSTSPKKTLPQHPTKMHRRSAAAYNTANNNIIGGNGNGGGGGGRSAAASPAPGAQSGAPRLLENWPNYLERLSTSSAMNRNYLNATQDASTPSRMQLSYESSSAAGRGLLSKCPTPVPYIVPPSGLGEPFAHSLTFDSDFESGNLLRAVQKGDLNYDLFLRSDLHTPGHTQWFYFAVANTHSPELVALAAQGVEVPPVRVKFNIVNFTKPDSLFNLGMRPVVYSVQDAATKNAGWVRGGSDISYYGNSFLRNNSAGEGLLYYYTLSFTMEFSNINDTTLIAYSYPYTMSDYRSHLSEILTSTSSDIIRQYKLCQALSGEDCDLLVITNHNDRERNGPLNLQMVEAESNNNNVAFSSKRSSSVGKRGGTGAGGASAGYKPALFLSCRVHPGETPASWMMKGMLEFLTSDCPQAVLLRQVFVIFIVPMLNPDGVIYGNNRCNLSGVDLNRQWKLPIKSLHPTVFHLKYFMQAQRKIRDISMYIDLHGHSRKYNVFMYGCEDKKRPKPQVRSFPKFFSMHNVGRKYVCYNDCSFAVKKGRESTARVVVSKEINIVCSFTLEATFCGSNYGPLKHCHMNIGHLQEVGTSLCDTILNFSISEGTVRDTLTVPHNIRAVQAIEKIIQNDGLGSTNEYSSVGYGGSGGMYTSGGTVGTGTVASGGMEESRERSSSNASGNGESASGKGSDKISGEKRGVGAITINTTTNALTSSRRLAASAAAAADLALNTNTADGEFQEQSATECDTATPTTGPYTSSREVYSRGSAVGGTGGGSGGTGTGAEGGGGNGYGGEEDGNTSNVDTENENEEVGSGSDESDADGSDTESVVVNNNTSSNAMNNMYAHTTHHTNTANANNSSMYGNNTGIGMLYNGSGGGGGIHSSVSMNGMNEMMHTNNNSRTRMETLSAESGRGRLQNASSFNNGSTSGSASGMYGSGLVLTSPGLSKVLTSSGRNSILSNTNTVSGLSSATADKINTIRALTTPTLRSHTSSSNTSSSLTNTTNNTMNNTLHSYTGSLTGRGAHVSIEYDGDSISVGGASGVSGVSGVNDGIASLSLAGVSAGTHASEAEALFSKTKKGKKKKNSLTNTSTGGASGGTGASVKGEGGKDKEKSNIKEKGRTSKKSSSKEVMSLSQSLPTSGGGSNVGVTSSSAPSSSLFSNDEYELFDSTATGLNFGSTAQSANHNASGASANAKTSHSAGHTIVKAEYQDVVQRPDAVSDDGTGSSLAKAQAVATPFGLPKLK